MLKFPFILFVATLALVGCFGCSPTAAGEGEPLDGDIFDRPDKTPKNDTFMWRPSFDTLRLPDSVGTMVDARDGRTYKWVQIDDRRWFAQNLAYVPKHGKTFVYTNDTLDSTASIAKYGRAYDYAAIVDSTNPPQGWNQYWQGACPDGWEMPTAGGLENIAHRVFPNSSREPNPVTDSIFNSWSLTVEAGGTNTLQTSFAPTFGTDFDCDTSSTFANTVTNCKEVKRFVVTYAAIDTSIHSAKVNERVMSDPGQEPRYNVFRIRSANKVTGGSFTTSFSYGNSIIRRRQSDFSYIRCFQYVD